MSPTVGALLARGIATLKAAGINAAPGDARRLLADAIGVAPDRLTLALQDFADEGAARRFEAHLAARAAHRPVARILGWRDFWGRRFAVTDAVLDPRPETESLVACALDGAFDSVLDLGTGSGCILLSLLGDRPGARGLGTDVSGAALDVARSNARHLGLDGCAAWRRSDWWQAVEGRYDLIVSNPPYIGADELAALAPEVAQHDPAEALSPGADALAAYRVLAGDAGRHLAPGGRLLLEIGWRQGRDVATILSRAGFEDIEIRPDLDGRDRVVVAISGG